MAANLAIDAALALARTPTLAAAMRQRPLPAGLPVLLANSSAVAWLYGNTVEEPVTLIWSRAAA